MYSTKDVTKHSMQAKDRSFRWVRGLGSPIGFDERALAVFQLDTLIPDQYLGTYKRRVQLAPERALMLALLQDAVVSFQGYVGAQDRRRRKLYLEAEEWLMSEDSHYLFSFENVCSELGLDPSYLRQGLLQWKAVALAISRARRRAS